MFIPDTPISTAQEDVLDRADFARKLGEAIRDWDRTDSIVLALYGQWGSGKTSILNIAVEHIAKTAGGKSQHSAPITVKFNPWNFSEQNQLLEAFFRSLFAGIKDFTPDKGKELWRTLRRFSKALGAFEEIPTVGKIAGGIRKAISALEPDETLEKLKAELVQSFQKLNRRLIVVIDDIDRLTQLEIRQIFQLIKVNADFPNTIYLVAFDRGVVEKALDTEQGVSGREYLEKIVQVGFEIPAADPAFISGMLTAELDKILTALPLNYWDATRWGNLYHAGFKTLFESIRDVKRFVNSLAFNLRIVPEEINPIDFIGLEALRVFAPEAYEGIARNKTLFTSTGGQWGRQPNQAELKQQYEEVFSKTQKNLRPMVEGICRQLFPQTKWAYENTMYGPEWQVTWRKERRICAEDVFDVYFLLGTPKGEVSQVELRQVVTAASEPSQLLTIFNNIRQSGRIARMLVLLDDILGELNESELLGLCEALLILGDQLPNEQRGFFDLGTDRQILIVVYRALLKLSEDKRCAWLEHQIANGPSFSTAIRLVAWDDHEEGKPREYPLVSEACLESLKELCVRAIVARAQQGQLRTVKGLAFVLVYWRRWAKDLEPLNVFVAQQISTQEGLLNFISLFAQQGYTHTVGDYISRPYWYVDLKALEQFIDHDRLVALISSLSTDNIERMSDSQKAVVRALLDALKKKESGTDEGEFASSD